MKISVDVQPLLNAKKSGIGYYGHNVLKELRKLPVDLVLECFSKEKNDPRLSEYSGGNTVLDCCAKISSRLYTMINMFFPLPRSLFFKNNPEVSLFFNYIIPPNVKGKRAVVIHDMVLRDIPETMSLKNKIIMRVFMKRSLKRADIIITDSEFSRSRIENYYGFVKDKITVIPCGTDREIFHSISEPRQISDVKNKYKIAGDYFLYLGTVEPRKNITALIKAYQKVTESYSDAPVLVIAGGSGWKNREIYEAASDQTLKDKILFTGYVDENEIPPLLNGALAFCFPSYYEGFGLPVLEAMACGTPVIASKAASIPEVIGDCGILIDPYSEEEIGEAMLRLWRDPDLREMLSQKGLARSELFSWQKCAKKIYTLLYNMIDK